MYRSHAAGTLMLVEGSLIEGDFRKRDEERSSDAASQFPSSSHPVARLITTTLLAKRQSSCLQAGERSASRRLGRGYPSLAKRNC